MSPFNPLATTARDSVEAGPERIAEIVCMIDGVAFLTRMLALNDAARAGQHGRGVGVVDQGTPRVGRPSHAQP